jgi:hypothetical protein
MIVNKILQSELESKLSNIGNNILHATKDLDKELNLAKNKFELRDKIDDLLNQLKKNKILPSLNQNQESSSNAAFNIKLSSLQESN